MSHCARLLSDLSLIASTYFHLPIDEEEDQDIENYERKYLTWVAEPSGSSTRRTPQNDPPPKSAPQSPDSKGAEVVRAVLETDDLYQILGVPKQATLDKMTLRRAYLARSKACHPECVAILSILYILPYIQPVNFPTIRMQHMLFKKWQLHMMSSVNLH